MKYILKGHQVMPMTLALSGFCALHSTYCTSPGKSENIGGSSEVIDIDHFCPSWRFL